MKHMIWAFISVTVALLAGCSQSDYPQDSPEATIASARKMVEAGEAKQLHTLIYAEDENMRALVSRSGKLLGHLEQLAVAISAKFPKEVVQLRTRAQAAAAAGQSTNIVGQFAKNLRSQSRQVRNGPPVGEDRRAFDDAAIRVFADPYAFLRESEGKISSVPLNDDMAALMWEGKPILPPIGLTMKRDDAGKWYFLLPTSAPALAGYMPKSAEQYELAGKLFVVLDKTVMDLTKEVESGRIATIEGVSRRAGEMTFVPAVLVMYAYAKYEKSQTPVKAGGG